MQIRPQPRGSSKETRYVLYSKNELPPLLTIEEEKELADQVKNGTKKQQETAKARFIESNLRLVITVARGYEGLGLDFEDLVSEGNIGLTLAVDKFDPNKGAKFSTYAGFWIRQKMMRALSTHTDTIRLPVYLKQLYLSIKKFEYEFELKNNREPSVSEIAKKFEVSQQKVLDIREVTRGVVCLDNPIDVEAFSSKVGAETLNDIIADFSALTPLLKLEERDQSSVIHNLLNKLDPRERFTIMRRFGLDNDEPDTLEKVGVKLGVTRERIRQIEKVALFKLKGLYERISEYKK